MSNNQSKRNIPVEDDALGVPWYREDISCKINV